MVMSYKAAATLAIIGTAGTIGSFGNFGRELFRDREIPPEFQMITDTKEELSSLNSIINRTPIRVAVDNPDTLEYYRSIQQQRDDVQNYLDSLTNTPQIVAAREEIAKHDLHATIEVRVEASIHRWRRNAATLTGTPSTTLGFSRLSIFPAINSSRT